MSIGKLVRSTIGARSVRVTLAIGLVGLGLWAYAPFAAYRISSSAFINSEVVRITAPIPGYLSSDLPQKGKYIETPQTLTLIRSYAEDRQRLLEMEGQQAAAKARAGFAEKQLVELATLDELLRKRMTAYSEAMRARTNHEIAETKAARTGCLAEAGYRQDIGSKMQSLADTGITSRIRSAEMLALQEATNTKCKMASARLEKLQAELQAMENGIFLRDAGSDVPYTQQQRERLFLKRQELEQAVNENNVRAAQLAGDIAEERRRVARLAKFDTTLPGEAVVWSVSASPGSVVVQGQTVLDLTDCKHRFVAVQLPEREFESIKPGDAASIRLIGSDERRQGYVRQIIGSAARNDDRLFAARVPSASKGNITVEVSLPPDAETGERSYCDIGRLAEVRFLRKAPLLVEGLRKFFRPVVALFTPADKVAEG